jgi:flagellar biosynthesis/type III secretory pathway chaperone
MTQAAFTLGEKSIEIMRNSMQITERLTELIERKHEVLTQLREVGKRQLAFVTGRDTASLIKLLAAKQSLISGLQAIERELAPFSAEHPELRIWNSVDARAQCASRAAECNTMLREIVDLDRQGVDQMTLHRNEIAEQLQEVHTAVDVRNAYRAQR